LKKVDGKWSVATDELKTYAVWKLIDATSLTSITHAQHTSGISQFQDLALHSRDFGKPKVLANNSR
jgi:hypothetical protein